jgi:hypothetical protein
LISFRVGVSLLRSLMGVGWLGRHGGSKLFCCISALICFDRAAVRPAYRAQTNGILFRAKIESSRHECEV